MSQDMIELMKLHTDLVSRWLQPALAAERWETAGFTVEETNRWLNARCYDPEAAQAIKDAGLTLNQARVHTNRGQTAEVETVGFKVARGHINPEEWAQNLILREQVMWVFGLTGGELMDPRPDEPDDAWDGRFWFEDVPDDAEREYDDWAIHPYRTVCLDMTHGEPDIPGWTFMSSHQMPQETPCPTCGEDSDWNGSDAQVLAQHKDPITPTGYRGDPSCRLCDGDGTIFLSGWPVPAMAIYRRIEEDEERS